MLWLSLCKPQKGHSKALQAFRDPYFLHQVVDLAYPSATEKQGRILWRLDSSGWGDSRLLVQTDFLPSPDRLNKAGFELLSKDFEPIFTADQVFSFRLRANPTKRLRTMRKEEKLDPKIRGARVGLKSEQEALEWLLRKSQSCGFEAHTPSLAVCVEGLIKLSGKGEKGIQLHSVLFEGTLRVTDPARFQAALTGGIGSGKAFGFGLLSLRRLP